MSRITLLLLLVFSTVCSQTEVTFPEYLRQPSDSLKRIALKRSVQDLFKSLDNVNLDSTLISNGNTVLTIGTLNKINDYMKAADSTKSVIRNITNVSPIEGDVFLISAAYILDVENDSPLLIAQINLVAKENGEQFQFDIPLDYYTRYWNETRIGTTTYVYRDGMDFGIAEQFQAKNEEIAKKLGVEAENLNFYIVDNYQEVLKLRGIAYSINDNGQYRDGYGVVGNTIFSVMKSPDFSHDMFHYYSGKVNKRENRNWITEEGLAYLWGDAYYTDKEGKPISFKRLVDALKEYIEKHPDVNLYKLFSENIRIYDDIAPEVSVRSTLAGLIAHYVEKKKGKEGIIKLINAGRKDRLNNFLRVTSEIVNINSRNFNRKVLQLITDY